jgi:hypothetical protein
MADGPTAVETGGSGGTVAVVVAIAEQFYCCFWRHRL